jgi:hypothetical protein
MSANWNRKGIPAKDHEGIIACVLPKPFFVIPCLLLHATQQERKLMNASIRKVLSICLAFILILLGCSSEPPGPIKNEFRNDALSWLLVAELERIPSTTGPVLERT